MDIDERYAELRRRAQAIGKDIYIILTEADIVESELLRVTHKSEHTGSIEGDLDDVEREIERARKKIRLPLPTNDR